MVSLHTPQELDRIFYEYLRLKLVALGYIPDKLLSTTKQEYDTARTAVKTSGKELIDVFGHSTEENKGEKSLNRFVVGRLNSEDGTMGGSPATYSERYEESEGVFKFRKKFYPEKSRHINYEVRLICGSSAYDSIMSVIIDSALGYRRYVKTILPDGSLSTVDVLIERTGDVNMSEKGYIERVYRYKVMDVFIQDAELIREGIPQLNTVDFGIIMVNQNDERLNS